MASARALGSIVCLGAIGTVLARSFTVLVPVIGVALSAWLLGDPITPFVGGALVLVGLWLVQSAPRAAPSRTAASVRATP